MSLISKYAVPFNNRRSSTNDSIVTKLVQGGIGYLKIELPVNPLINNCIGFKIKVTSEDNKELLFEGHISGSSSDGYNWIYVSSNESELSKIKGNPTLFCYKYIDTEKGNDPKNILKSVLLGTEDTNWGSLILVSIEVIQATLSTSPDGEDNKISTQSIEEYSSLSVSTDESNPKARMTDGWRFEVGQITDEIISMTVSKVDKDTSSSIILEGVITGVARTDESGNIVIETEFNGGSINLHDPINDTYGKIVADGSELIGLENNESLKNMTFTSTGFRDPVIIKSTKDSDVSLDFSIQKSGVTITPRVNVSKLNLGNWSSDNTRRFSVKSSIDSGTNSPVFNVPLEYGGLGFINSGLNTDLYVGTGSKNILVGAAKICKNKSEFDSIDKVDGRIIIYEDKVYVCNDGEVKTTTFSSKISLDEVKNGYFYEKVNADAQLGGEVVRLKHDGGLLLANDIYGHLVDHNVHISKSDRDKWNSKLDSDNSYTKVEVDNLLKSMSNKSHYHGYHDPVNEVLSGDTDFSTHNYPYGHRILVREHLDLLPYIKIAGKPNEWLGREEFGLGHRVTTTFGDYFEYTNIDNKIVRTGGSSSGSSVSVISNTREPDESDKDLMKTGDWYIYKGGY